MHKSLQNLQLDEEKCNFDFFENKHLLDFDQLYDDLDLNLVMMMKN
jgi:hypothetical protein